jgi:hypothetical protein
MNFPLFILLLVGLNAVVSFAIAAILRSNVLCIIASAVITESLFVLYGSAQAANSPDVYDILLAVNITAMVSTPVIVGTSVGFVFLARRLYRRNATPSESNSKKV